MSVLYKILMFLLITTLQVQATDFGSVIYEDYCKMNCKTPFGERKHTVCERKSKKCGPDERCVNYKAVDMTPVDINKILEAHNNLRNKVASGHETIGNQPSASNMNELSWDHELAMIAQCWANTCQIGQHDQCRRTHTLEAGQNMAYHGQSWPIDETSIDTLANESIHSWYEEVQQFDTSEIDIFKGGNHGTGHYTQMVWADTTKLGCGASTFFKDGWHYYFLCCNYGAKQYGGNVINDPIYLRGQPCSKCSSKECSSEYSALCKAPEMNSNPITDTFSNSNESVHRNNKKGNSALENNKSMDLRDNINFLFITIFWLFFYKLLSDLK